MTVSVGLVGAGPWARMVHAPVLAAGPETELAAVWSRTKANAAELATRHRTVATETFDELLDRCDAVAFCVSPEAQPELATRAARAGKALLLEKPLGMDVASARRLADAVDDAGVGSVVVFTYRFGTGVRSFLDRARELKPIGGRACFISGAFLEASPFAYGWRLEHGALLDVGPHVIDLLDAALGPVAGLRAHGEVRGWIGLLLEHESGAVSEASICCRAAIPDSRTDVAVYGERGVAECDARVDARPETFATLRSEFAGVAEATAQGRDSWHPLNARHALRIQEVIDRAARSIGVSGS